MLLPKLLGSIQSPIANFARVVAQIAEQKESGEPAPAKEEAKEEAEDIQKKIEEAGGKVTLK